MEQGYLSLVLHAHLPFVRHPEHEFFLEEDWLYEAITETYVPLIKVFSDLINEGVKFRITMSMTPPLVSMLQDELLQSRYVRYLESSIELTEKEIVRTKNEPELNKLALMYNMRFKETYEIFVNRYKRDIVQAFKKFQDEGYVEIITCNATHGFLPLMDYVKPAVRAQILIARDHYKNVFKRNPNGIWLAECGYYPGHEEYLKEAGIKFFFTDTHGILYGTPRPKYGIYAPVYTPAGVAAFGRDVESSKSVWSADIGYPGDYNYREFYRDIGFDLDFDYIKPYIHPDGIRKMTGIKYYKITGKGETKEYYNEQKAVEKAAEHAGNFLFNRTKQVEFLNSMLGKKPIIVSPYDAELFGHWWYEGPLFIYYLAKKAYYDQDIVRMVTPMEYLEENPKNQIVTPTMSSWGDKGYNDVWLNSSNDWIYRHLIKAAERMVNMADSYPHASGIKKRVLNQMARELLLAQSSDWAFIMTTNTMVEYAVKRTRVHINRFTKLYDMLINNSIDENYLKDIESKDNIFPDINYKYYRNGDQE